MFANANFCGLFDPKTTLYDPVTAKSRTRYIIKYMDCLIIWASKLQTETTLLTCEAEYTTCSEVLHAAIPLMDLIDEGSSFGIPVSLNKTKVFCKLFCDNRSCGAVETL